MITNWSRDIKTLRSFRLVFFLLITLLLLTMVVFGSTASILIAVIAFIVFMGTGADLNIRTPKRQSPTPSYPYKQTSRDVVIARGMRPARVAAAAKRQVSILAYPASTCAGYTSTGTVPWAVYTGVDIDGGDYLLINDVATREACYVQCEQNSRCIATTYSTASQQCFLVYSIIQYKPPTPFLITKRNADCASNAANVPANYAADYGATCCTGYRSS